MIICLSQSSSLLGIQGVPRSAYASIQLYNLLVNLPRAQWESCVFGLLSLIALLLFRRVKILARPSILIVSVIATVLSYVLSTKAGFHLELVGSVPAGL